jgi:hypothetical protein
MSRVKLGVAFCRVSCKSSQRAQITHVELGCRNSPDSISEHTANPKPRFEPAFTHTLLLVNKLTPSNRDDGVEVVELSRTCVYDSKRSGYLD